MRKELWLSTIIHNKQGRFTITDITDEMTGLGFKVNKWEVKQYIDSIVGTETSKGKLEVIN